MPPARVGPVPWRRHVPSSRGNPCGPRAPRRRLQRELRREGRHARLVGANHRTADDGPAGHDRHDRGSRPETEPAVGAVQRRVRVHDGPPAPRLRPPRRRPHRRSCHHPLSCERAARSASRRAVLQPRRTGRGGHFVAAVAPRLVAAVAGLAVRLRRLRSAGVGRQRSRRLRGRAHSRPLLRP